MTGTRCWRYGKNGCRAPGTNSVRIGARVLHFCNDPDHKPNDPQEGTAMSITHKIATDLAPGDVMAFPFGKTATITSVKVGRQYVNLVLDGGRKTRVLLYEEVVLEQAVAPDPMSKRWHTLPEAMTGAALARRLREIADSPQQFTASDRARFLQEAARRLEVY